MSTRYGYLSIAHIPDWCYVARRVLSADGTVAFKRRPGRPAFKAKRLSAAGSIGTPRSAGFSGSNISGRSPGTRFSILYSTAPAPPTHHRVVRVGPGGPDPGRRRRARRLCVGRGSVGTLCRHHSFVSTYYLFVFPVRAILFSTSSNILHFVSSIPAGLVDKSYYFHAS